MSQAKVITTNSQTISLNSNHLRELKSGGAESWDKAPELQALMIEAACSSKPPIFFFQAENDFDLSPSKSLSSAMKAAGKSRWALLEEFK